MGPLCKGHGELRTARPSTTKSLDMAHTAVIDVFCCRTELTTWVQVVWHRRNESSLKDVSKRASIDATRRCGKFLFSFFLKLSLFTKIAIMHHCQHTIDLRVP